MLHRLRSSAGQRRACLCVVLSISALAEVACGQITIDWDNSAGGSYSLANNWNPANVPDTATETARFDLDETMTVTFPASYTAKIDELLAPQGDLTFRNAGSFQDATLTVADDAILDGGDLTLL